MKVLVIQYDSIGQVLLTTPVVRSFKTQLNADVHFLTKKFLTQCLEASPYIDNIFSIESETSNLPEEILSGDYDVVVDLQGDKVTRSLKRIYKSKYHSIERDKLNLWLLIYLKINRLSNLHIVEKYINCVSEFGITLDNLGLDYFIPEKDEIELNWLPKTHQEGYVILSIHGAYRTRKLPTKRLIELCDRINRAIVLIGNEEDVETAEEISSFFEPGTEAEELEIEQLNKKTVIFNACGKFSANQTASLIDKANWVFTHDSDDMHIAAALKKKIYTIWGNTTPFFGQYPFRTQFTIFENNKINCRPCSSKGFDKCPKGHFKCMQDLQFDFYLPE